MTQIVTFYRSTMCNCGICLFYLSFYLSDTILHTWRFEKKTEMSSDLPPNF